ncbi:MAG: repair protein RecO protein [Parcubacteria group bacterium GW2011_GWB1_57_6]|nr:MAG: repair protein RecO protein [Parcubacteria group bacterium GW2011_GWA1_56_13]KKW47046.1 MAG: repair protein RecO protein [Parcubacteria group bacterium GW2011_GWB1_57_6]
MRHKYETRGIVLSRSPLGEANTFVTLLTPDLGLVRARAQGLRRPGAKLAAALATFAESEIVLLRGKEHWRIAGAVLEENWFSRIQGAGPRVKAARACGLLLRLVAGEVQEPALFSIMKGFFEALATLPEDVHDALEVLVVLYILAALGFDAERVVNGAAVFTPELVAEVMKHRSRYIRRINHGITASGL